MTSNPAAVLVPLGVIAAAWVALGVAAWIHDRRRARREDAEHERRMTELSEALQRRNARIVEEQARDEATWWALAAVIVTATVAARLTKDRWWRR